VVGEGMLGEMGAEAGAMHNDHLSPSQFGPRAGVWSQTGEHPLTEFQRKLSYIKDLAKGHKISASEKLMHASALRQVAAPGVQ
jgi:hypothetical protein